VPGKDANLMGYYRGIPQTPKKRQRLDQVAAAMRERFLNHGKGCKARARAIAVRRSKQAI
jgi:hypothetical protein